MPDTVFEKCADGIERERLDHRKPGDLYRAIAHYHAHASHATPAQIAAAFRAPYGRNKHHTRDYADPREHKVDGLTAGRAT